MYHGTKSRADKIEPTVPMTNGDGIGETISSMSDATNENGITGIDTANPCRKLIVASTMFSWRTDAADRWVLG